MRVRPFPAATLLVGALLFVHLPAVPSASAQAPASAASPEAEVRAAIDQLFNGMRAGDSTMVRAVLHAEALMGRALYNEGASVLRTGPPDRFINAIGTPHEQVWDERIWDVQIHVDRNLASAWMWYAFFLGEDFHHCGVNSMQLFRADDGWKIVYLLDTDHGTACELPEWE